MTNSVTTQIGIETFSDTGTATSLVTTQIGAAVFYSSTTPNTNFQSSQIGAEAWWRIGTVFQSSQIGVEVWRSVANYVPPPPPARGFNMPMLGM